MRTILALLYLALSAKADPIPISPELRAYLTRRCQQWRLMFENCASPKLKRLHWEPP